MGHKPRQKLLVKAVYAFEIIGIHTANLHILILEKPGGKSAEIPLGTDVGSGTNYCVKSDLLRDFKIFFNIEYSRKVEFSGLLLVKVPADIGFNRVEACRFEFCQSVLPIFGNGAEVVHCARVNVERL